MLTNAPFIS